MCESGKVDIDIHFEYNEGEITIMMADSGTGGDANQINEHICGKVNITKNDSDLGVRNVNEESVLNGGEDYGLRYEALPDGRITAIIYIPRIDG